MRRIHSPAPSSSTGLVNMVAAAATAPLTTSVLDPMATSTLPRQLAPVSADATPPAMLQAVTGHQITTV